MDSGALSNVLYDDLPVGERAGPYREHVSADMAARLAGPIGGRGREVAHAPPAVYPVLFLKALRRSLGGIPAGAVLAKQELELHAPLPVPADVQLLTWVGERYVRRDRPYAVVEVDVRDAQEQPVASGRMVIVWPTGPGER